MIYNQWSHLLGKLHNDGLSPFVELVLGVLLLLFQCGHHVRVGALLPVVQPVDLTRVRYGTRGGVVRDDSKRK